MQTTLSVILSVALLGLACEGISYTGDYYPKGRNYYPTQTNYGGSYGPYYPSRGYQQHGSDLNLPSYCYSRACLVPACQGTRCRRYPQARCVDFCGGCVARFFIGRVNVTPYCGGSTLPGKHHQKY
uniref:Uncharacterized protein n=1 Tax=Magallana gigas TaxID=29159 RepID=A0A8W8P4B9_MAGGI|nr:uncharacterized protein LOC117687026 [Crassostrea gigas]